MPLALHPFSTMEAFMKRTHVIRIVISLSIVFLACGRRNTDGSSFENSSRLAVPANVTVAAGDQSASLSWDAVDDAEYYKISYGKSDALDGTDAAEGASGFQVTTASATLTRLTNDQIYSFAVTAGRATGQPSERSAIVKATPQKNAQNNAPVVTRISPTEIKLPNSNDITVSGSGFSATDKVVLEEDGTFNEFLITFVSSSEIRFHSTTENPVPVGQLSLKVKNAAGKLSAEAFSLTVIGSSQFVTVDARENCLENRAGYWTATSGHPSVPTGFLPQGTYKIKIIEADTCVDGNFGWGWSCESYGLNVNIHLQFSIISLGPFTIPKTFQDALPNASPQLVAFVGGSPIGFSFADSFNNDCEDNSGSVTLEIFQISRKEL